MKTGVGSIGNELDRTAEMIVERASPELIADAIWLIYDSNRFDAASMKYLAERVQARSKNGNRVGP